MKDPCGSILVTNLESLAPEQRHCSVALRDRFEHGVRALIREGMECQEFAPTDEKISALAILGAINWISKMVWSRGAAPPGGDRRDLHDAAGARPAAVGWNAAPRAAPERHTLFIGTTGTHATNPWLVARVRYGVNRAARRRSAKRSTSTNTTSNPIPAMA